MPLRWVRSSRQQISERCRAAQLPHHTPCRLEELLERANSCVVPYRFPASGEELSIDFIDEVVRRLWTLAVAAHKRHPPGSPDALTVQ